MEYVIWFIFCFFFGMFVSHTLEWLGLRWDYSKGFFQSLFATKMGWIYLLSANIPLFIIGQLVF